MKTRISLFIAALCTWIILTSPVSVRSLAAGVGVAALVAFLTGDIFEGTPRAIKNPARYIWFLYFLPFCAWEWLKANIESAYQVFHPDLPIRPGIVKIKTSLTSDAGLTLLANTLTLMPGTMTVDIDREEGFLYIHWISVKTQQVDEATAIIARRLEEIIRRIFD
ncbi:MAG: Na+/H+ antiporter subunit E [Candidatus Omnitrophota bacterium]